LTIELRRATEADIEFLMALRRTTMWAHFENSGCEIDERAQLERVLYRLDCARIITRDGADIGLLKVVRDSDPWELAQIQLLPAQQGQGLGRRLLQQLLDEATAAGKSVVLDVLQANPARHLYERLGFHVVGDADHGYLMRFDAPPRRP
jgi:ribosomal protein S18 acetylase RimI-like enzyme